MADIAETLQAGLDHHRAGRLQEAENLYKQVLEIHPRHAGAVHLLGLISFQVGKHQLAAQLIERAVEFDGHRASYRADLGEVYRALDRAGEAIAAYRKALELNPKMAGTLTHLGTLLEAGGESDEAERCYREALAIDPNHAEAQAAWGAALQAKGQLDEAAAALEAAARAAPDNADVCFKLGRCLHAQGKLLEAIACYQKVARLRPQAHAPHYQLGCAYRARGQLDRAATHFAAAAQLAPQQAEVHYNLAVVRREQGRLAEALEGFRSAIRCDRELTDAHLAVSNLHLVGQQPDEAAAAARRAVELCPDSASAAAHLAGALQMQGDATAAVAAYRRAVELDPADARSHSQLLVALHFDPAVDSRLLAAEHRAWAVRHAEPLTAAAPPHRPGGDPSKRLRVGYVSPVFSRHAISSFSLPLIAAHDSSAVEVYCYADSNLADGVTARFRQAAQHWRPIAGLDDQAVAEQIRRDEIDVLVDLAGHTGQNRLLVFARKPAPIQMTYLGYPDTTGMSAMDYRLSDEHLDPPEFADGRYTEGRVGLPRCFCCYAPAETAPEPGPLPAIAAGHVTFGWLGDMLQLSTEEIDIWAKILTAVGGSRLLVLAPRSAVFEARVHATFARLGVEPARVEFVAPVDYDGYMRLYQRIDVALDALAWNGLASICDGLWMGVPSVVRAGPTCASRLGVTVLSNLRLDALIARSTDDYVRIATGLASNLPGLAELRSRLRGQMTDSPLSDAAGLARYVEDAYRKMWQAWCQAD